LLLRNLDADTRFHPATINRITHSGEAAARSVILIRCGCGQERQLRVENFAAPQTFKLVQAGKVFATSQPEAWRATLKPNPLEIKATHVRTYNEEGFFAALRECDVIPRNANFVAQLDSLQYRFSRKIKKVTAAQNDGGSNNKEKADPSSLRVPPSVARFAHSE
jgi:hypothetical protein